MIDHRLTEREWAEEWKHLNSVSAQVGLQGPCDSQNVYTTLEPKAGGRWGPTLSLGSSGFSISWQELPSVCLLAAHPFV